MKERKGNQFRAPQNQMDALTLALKLAITAPSDKQMALAAKIAEELAESMSELEVMRCKKRALTEIGMH